MQRLTYRVTDGSLVSLLAPACLAVGCLGFVGCAAERQPLTAVPQRYSYAAEGVTLGEPAERASSADRFLNSTVDRPSGSMGSTAAAAGFE